MITDNTNAALFSAGPAVAPDGTLTYTAAANAAGTATITLVAAGQRRHANGGVDQSAPQTFTITITGVNTRRASPSARTRRVLEDSGAQTRRGWATAISPGPADEAAQTITFNVTGNTNPRSSAPAPAVSPTAR